MNQTKDVVLAKFKAAKAQKERCLQQLEVSMKETFKMRTGEDAKQFFAL